MRSSSSELVAAATVAARMPRRIGFGSPWSRLPVWLRRSILLAVLIGGWQAYISWAEPNPFLFASPWDTAKAFWEGWKTGVLASATVETMKLLGFGMAIGTSIALVLTAFATVTRVGDDLLSLLTAMINPLPGIAILPLAMLWFGLDSDAIIFVIANAVVWPIAINVSMGFKTVNPTIVAVGRNIGLSGRRLVTDVLAPAALPHAISGIRTAWAFGWRTIVAAELVFGVSGSKGGIGWQLNELRLNLDTPGVFAALVTIMLIGIAFDLLFLLLERRTVVRWGMKRVDESGRLARLTPA